MRRLPSWVYRRDDGVFDAADVAGAVRWSWERGLAGDEVTEDEFADQTLLRKYERMLKADTKRRQEGGEVFAANTSHSAEYDGYGTFLEEGEEDDGTYDVWGAENSALTLAGVEGLHGEVRRLDKEGDWR